MSSNLKKFDDKQTDITYTISSTGCKQRSYKPDYRFYADCINVGAFASWHATIH